MDIEERMSHYLGVRRVKLIELQDDQKITDLTPTPGVSYLFIYREPSGQTIIGGGDNLYEIDGIIHAKGLTFKANCFALFEVPGDVNVQQCVNQMGDIIDRFFGIRGERSAWTPH